MYGIYPPWLLRLLEQILISDEARQKIPCCFSCILNSPPCLYNEMINSKIQRELLDLFIHLHSNPLFGFVLLHIAYKISWKVVVMWFEYVPATLNFIKKQWGLSYHFTDFRSSVIILWKIIFAFISDFTTMSSKILSIFLTHH